MVTALGSGDGSSAYWQCVDTLMIETPHGMIVTFTYHHELPHATLVRVLTLYGDRGSHSHMHETIAIVPRPPETRPEMQTL